MTDKQRNYRPWTCIEDAKLVEALVSMVNTVGFKADNGFKSGYLVHIEKTLKESLPNSGIMGKPHVESRIKTMKKDWQVVYDMVYGANTSGFGYDSLTQCVTAEPAVWEAYIKVHKDVAKWKNKTFPHFEDLCIVFEKDKAQGNRAKDFIEMKDAANIEEQMEDNLDEPIEVSPGAHTSTTVQSEDSSSARSRKRKARVDLIIEGITNAVTLLEKELQQVSASMNQALQAEVELQKKTSMVSSEISKIQSMSAMDRFKASRKIMSELEAVLTFWNLEGEERKTFVKFILEE